MAQTPYNKLGSQDILSAHISGIQADVNKIQSVLDMQTSTRSGHTMTPVTDQEDPSVRYRIYEASERNWLENPTPILYRNGVSINSEEYTLQAPYGVVVFHEQQDSNDNITADFTHITGSSGKILEIEGKIDDLSNSDGEEPEISLPDNFGTGPIIMSGSYFSHQRKDVDIYVFDENRSVGFNQDAYHYAEGIVTNALTLDAFPLIVPKRMSFSGATVQSFQTYAVRVRVGVYSDDNGRPGELIFGTSDIIVGSGEWGTEDIELTLEPGLYWIARQDKSNSRWGGLNRMSVEYIQRFDAHKLQEGDSEYITHYGGYRATNVPWTDDTSMPSTFPSSGELFRRTDYATPWLIVE